MSEDSDERKYINKAYSDFIEYVSSLSKSEELREDEYRFHFLISNIIKNKRKIFFRCGIYPFSPRFVLFLSGTPVFAYIAFFVQKGYGFFPFFGNIGFSLIFAGVAFFIVMIAVDIAVRGDFRHAGKFYDLLKDFNSYSLEEKECEFIRNAKKYYTRNQIEKSVYLIVGNMIHNRAECDVRRGQRARYDEKYVLFLARLSQYF